MSLGLYSVYVSVEQSGATRPFLSRLVWAAFSCFISMCSFRFVSLWLGPSRALFWLCLFPLPFRRGLALCVLHFTLFHVVICSFWLNFDTSHVGAVWTVVGAARTVAVDVCGGFGGGCVWWI